MFNVTRQSALLPICALTIGVFLLSESSAEAQLMRRLFGRSSGSPRSQPEPAPGRSSPDTYRRGGPARPSATDSYDPELESDIEDAPRTASRNVEPKTGFLGRMFGRGRDSSRNSDEVSGRSSNPYDDSNLDDFPSKSPRKSDSKKKPSELLNPRELTPITQKPVEPYGGRTPKLAAPKSSREGSTRREPFALRPADDRLSTQSDDDDSVAVLPPSPEDVELQLEETRNATRSTDRRPAATRPGDRQPSRLAPEPSGRAKITRQSTRKPVVNEFGLDEGSDESIDERLEVPEDTEDSTAKTDFESSSTPEPSPESNFESAFDSPYSGERLSPRELESRRSLPPETSEIPRESSSRNSSVPAKAASRKSVDSLKGPTADTGSPTSDSTDGASRMRLHPELESRTGSRRGLMGYCPVALKETRELIPAQEEFSTQFAGRRFTLASASAKQMFESNPRRYIPALNGQDAVRLSNGERGVEGSLDHAAWFRGKLYLFSSDQNLQEFVNSPSDFVAFP